MEHLLTIVSTGASLAQEFFADPLLHTGFLIEWTRHDDGSEYVSAIPAFTPTKRIR